MRKIFFSLLAIIGSCSPGHRIVTMQAFSDIPLGATPQEVKEMAGSPYRVRKIDSETEEYEYIERIRANGRELEERHYYIRFKNGKVVEKKMAQDSPPPFDLGSYELQTGSLQKE